VSEANRPVNSPAAHEWLGGQDGMPSPFAGL
jgi:hypothetical protein